MLTSTAKEFIGALRSSCSVKFGQGCCISKSVLNNSSCCVGVFTRCGENTRMFFFGGARWASLVHMGFLEVRGETSINLESRLVVTKELTNMFYLPLTVLPGPAECVSLDLLNVEQFLLDGEWLELRYCSVNTISRAAYEHVHRARWSRFMRATIELIELLRTRECTTASEAFNVD